MRHLVLRGLGTRSSSLSTGRQGEAMASGMALWVEENLPSFIWLPFLFSYCILSRTLVVAVFHLPKGKAIGLNVLLAALKVCPQSPAVMSPPCSSCNHGPQAGMGSFLHEALLALWTKKIPPAWLTAHVLSPVQFFKIPWTVACQAPLSMARILEGVAISYFRGSSQPRDWSCISCISCFGGGFLTIELPGKPHLPLIFLFFFLVAHVVPISHPKYPVKLRTIPDSNSVSSTQNIAWHIVSSLPTFVEWIKEITCDW